MPGMRDIISFMASRALRAFCSRQRCSSALVAFFLRMGGSGGSVSEAISSWSGEITSKLEELRQRQGG